MRSISLNELKLLRPALQVSLAGVYPINLYRSYRRVLKRYGKWSVATSADDRGREAALSAISGAAIMLGRLALACTRMAENNRLTAGIILDVQFKWQLGVQPGHVRK